MLSEGRIKGLRVTQNAGLYLLIQPVALKLLFLQLEDK